MAQQRVDACGATALEYDQAVRHRMSTATATAVAAQANAQPSAPWQKQTRKEARPQWSGPSIERQTTERGLEVRDSGRTGSSATADSSGSSWRAHVTATDDVTGAAISMPGWDMDRVHITDRRRRELTERFGTAEQREEAVLTVRRGRIAAAHAALSCNTWSQNKTIMRMWYEFCELDGTDPTTFGCVHADEAPRPSQLLYEDNKLAEFAVYVTEYPRKRGMTHNTGQTAASYVSHVRTFYEFRLDPPRRVGGTGASEARDGLGHALRRCLKGLRKRHPSNPQNKRKAAVLRRHMMQVRALLDMRDPFSAMIWAFMCVAWQGGRRSGELVRSKARTGPWNPKFDMHRGRASWDWDADGTVCRRLRIALGPDKTDPSGEQGHTVFLPHDGEARINAASAVATMLAMDPTPAADNEKTPLFRDTRPGKNGKPMTYGSMMAVVKVLLMRAGMSVEDAGCHSYRRGTATALAHINAPSYVIKGIGIWGSDAYLGYVDATESGAMEMAMLAMAEADPTGVLGPRGISRS